MHIECFSEQFVCFWVGGGADVGLKDIIFELFYLFLKFIFFPFKFFLMCSKSIDFGFIFVYFFLELVYLGQEAICFGLVLGGLLSLL